MIKPVKRARLTARSTGLAAIALLIASAGVFPAAAAFASETDDLPDGFYAVVGDEYFPIDETSIDRLDDSALQGGPSAEPTNPEITPYLIDPIQYAQCFVLNMEELNFAAFHFYNAGVLTTKELKCGTAGWGYRHIKANHETDWQNKLNQLKAVTTYANSLSWDDMATNGIMAALQARIYMNATPAQNKECVVGQLTWVEMGVEKFRMTLVVSYATDSTRIITAFPQSALTC